jgi:hypothetical protein
MLIPEVAMELNYSLCAEPRRKQSGPARFDLSQPNISRRKPVPKSGTGFISIEIRRMI